MSYPTTIPAPTRPARRQWRILAVLLIAVIGVLGAVWWYLAWAEERDFQEALAETNRLDSGWRLDDIEAARAVIPDDQNAALVVLSVHKLVGAGVGLSQRLEEQMGALPLNVQYNGEQIAALHQLFEQHTKARAEAERLKDLPNGRHPSRYDAAKASLNHESLQWMREVMHFLQLDALLAAQENDDTRALALCRAGLNNACSVGDEPSLIAHLVRIACVEISVATIERVLAQTTPAPADLQQLQDLLQRESDEPRLLWAVRGDRALGLEMLAAVEQGKLPRSTVAARSGWRRWVADWLPGTVSLSRASYLRATNDLVEASKQPVEKQLDAVQDAVDRWSGRDGPVDALLPAYHKVATAHARNQARQHCALVAVAAERYRVEHGAWPASLEALVKGGQLKTVPLDPFDGRPLRYKRLADGVLVYSVGVDRVDNGGVIDRTNPIAPGTDLGVQLWDPEARRQPK